MNSIIFLVFLAVLLIALVVCVTTYIALSRKHAKEAEDSVFITSKKVGYDKWYNLYSVFISANLTKNFLEKLYKQYCTLNPGNEKEVKEKAVKVALIIWGISIVAIMVAILVSPNVFGICCAMWVIYNANIMITDTSYRKQDLKLRNEFSKFVSEVRHNFFTHGMVDEAIYESFDHLSKMMQGHALLIYDTLTAGDVEEAINKYNQSAPNNYMKQFVSICYITMTYGDKKVDGQSMFLKDIKDLKQTMDADLLHVNKVKAKFSGFVPISAAPMLAMSAIADWAIGVTPSLQKFYDGSKGLLLIIVAMIVSYIAVWGVKRLRDGQQVDKAEHPYLTWIYEHKSVRRFIFNFESYYHTKTYKLNQLLKRTGSSYNTKTMLLHRMCSFVAGFLVTIFVLTLMNVVQVNLALNDVREVADKASGTTDDQNVAMITLTSYYVNKYKSYDLVKMYKENIAPSSKVRERTEEIEEALKEYLLIEISDSDLSEEIDDDFLIRSIQSYNSNHSADTSLYTVLYGNKVGESYELPEDTLTLTKLNRDFSKIAANARDANGMRQEYIYEIITKCVIDHIAEYQDSAFKWWFILIAGVIGWLMYMLPIALLKFNEKELQNYMEDEVVQFQSIILILMNIDRMTVESILEEIVKFAVVFEPSLRTCLNSLSSGEQAALEKLYEDEPFEPFRRLVENLMTIDRIGVKQAFNELDIERQNYIERRKQEGEIKLDDRKAIASLVAYVPLSFILVSYMIIPFIVEAFSSLTDSLSNI